MAAFAPPPLFRGASLVVHDDTDAIDFAQVTLYGVVVVAVMQSHAGRESGVAAILLRLISDHCDALGGTAGHPDGG